MTYACNENRLPMLRSAVTAFLLFLLTTLLVRGYLGGVNDIAVLLMQSCVAAVIYFFLYGMIFSFSLWALSIAWLGLPVLIFVATWLKWYWAIIFTVGMTFALLSAIRGGCFFSGEFRFRLQKNFVWGVLPVLCWVSFSGAGGYGFQTPDYVLHNGRLEDLVKYAWPVFYGQPGDGKRQLLVTYSAYYLPAASMGKLFGLHAAREFMHYWTLAGCWLALRWLIQHSAIRSTMFAALVLILFGGWDIVGWIGSTMMNFHKQGLQFSTTVVRLVMDPAELPGWLDFWAGSALVSQYFFGNFVSLSASLFWAPHQSVAGWVMMGLLLAASKQIGRRYVVLLYALLALWSPMALIALIPFLVFILLQRRESFFFECFSFENITGLFFIFLAGFYYSSASALSNPAGLLVLKDGWLRGLPVLLVFHLLCWGIYAAAIYPVLHRMPVEFRRFFAVLCLALLLLPLFRYGTYNDLMVRASAPLLFCMAIFVLRAIVLHWSDGKSGRALLLVSILVPGMFSGVFHLANATINHGSQEKGQSVVDYAGGWQFLGVTDSIYVRFFSAKAADD